MHNQDEINALARALGITPEADTPPPPCSRPPLCAKCFEALVEEVRNA